MPAATASIQPLASSLIELMATPTKKPTIAVRDEKRLKSSAMYHGIPVDIRITKSPRGNKTLFELYTWL